ncbi:MAG: PH domain-containing protein [Acidimicrobiia bacterium]|nr:PH domain-containing protein [Acidimicrobiia bacterium]MBT8217726.1 PH domain-containing protein [Acidimicrobiia bacterium]NNF09547.1 PH domain-containing protein [Acidimicrobiia bacterium]NNL71485.1 PH domain-containing protein [Acidimicrobiia bacterium]
MRYPESLLSDGEEIIRGFRPHWKSLVIPVAWSVLVIIGLALTPRLPSGLPRNLTYVILLLGWIMVAVVPAVRWWFTQFVLTNERLVLRKGVIARSGVEIPLEVINDVIFSQTVFERMLGFGDLIIESAGEMGQSRFSNIPNPDEFQSLLYSTREIRARELSSSQSPSDTLATLARLHADGILTDEEFAAKKAKLLDEI